jgi:hypothetical protein
MGIMHRPPIPAKILISPCICAFVHDEPFFIIIAMVYTHPA